MAIPKQITFVTFDVYGTLIDWDEGAYGAFRAEATRDGFTIERDLLVPLFHSVQQQIQAGSYELYAEVLRRGDGLLHRPRGPPVGHRDPVTREQLLALVFEQIHA